MGVVNLGNEERKRNLPVSEVDRVGQSPAKICERAERSCEGKASALPLVLSEFGNGPLTASEL